MGMPPGITTHQFSLPNGKVYEYSHSQQGKLGRVIVTAERRGEENGTLWSAVAEHGDISDPAYLERLKLFRQIIQTIIERSPGEHPPILDLEEAIRRTALYQRFCKVQNAEEMKRFADGLLLQEQELLLKLIAENISTATQEINIDEMYAIAQREAHLRRILGIDYQS